MFLSIRFFMQTSYNVIAYKDKPRLRTALEMLRTTQEIESRLQEVRVLFLFVLVSFVYTRH
jgi:acylglycerol lipase